MKILKWLGMFTVAFLVAWILIFTFIQPQFKVLAPAKILSYITPEIPIYIYVAGAFGLGLMLGLFAAFYYYIALQRKVHRATKELQLLEEKLADSRRALEQCEMTNKMDELPPPEKTEIEPVDYREPPEDAGGDKPAEEQT